MDQEVEPSGLNLIYLFKVLTGLAIVAGLVAAALWLPLSAASPTQQRWGLGALLLAALLLIPTVQGLYRRRDELQQRLHQRASVASLSMLAGACCLLGILQAQQIVPLFNQFWTFGLMVALWGINLMLADRRFR